MIDMHSHVIHDVDDGSETFEESMKILERAANNGIKAMFATSHFLEGKLLAKAEDVIKKTESLNKSAEANNLDIKVFTGHEIYLDHQILDHLASKRALTLNNSRYVLIELPMLSPIQDLENILFDMTIKGFVPIIAHPERYVYVQRHPEILGKWINCGALIQVNIPSLMGKYGQESKVTAEVILRRQMCHFIGTDVHKGQSRVLNVQNTLEKIALLVGNNYEDIIINNPMKVIHDEPIEVFEIIEEKQSIFKRIRKLIG